MDSFNIAEGKARFSEIAARAEAGESVEITRRGRPVCKVVPIEQPKEPVDIAALEALAATLPFDASESVVEMRRQARY